ncbi:MAG: hypothetical protein KDA97_05780, partial [Acidimicrobiales bacterium]|nr:hypothetical protein [Acidimicrobiales bacterium]
MVPSRSEVRARLSGWGITPGVVALCLLWLVALGPIVADLTAQGAPRVALTGALVDDGAIVIDDYPLDVDRTERDGHTYSDKAPGQEVLAVPVYAAARAVGAEPASVPRIAGNLTLWSVTFWSAGVPAMALILLVAVACHRRGTPIPLPALAGLSFGTLLAPMGVNLYGHVLAAALGYGAWMVIDRAPATAGRGLAAGALVGLAVVVEYPLALVGAVLAAALVSRRAWAALGAFALAGAPFAVALGLYHHLAYGSVVSSGYSHKPDHEGATLFITGIPRPTTAIEMLVGSRGLLVFTPIAAVGLWGLVHLLRRRRDEGVVVSAAVVIAFLLLQAGWVNPWGGEMPGPRYLIPMLPFLGIGLAAVWHRVPAPVARFVLGISIASMGLAAVTDHLIGPGGLALTSSLRTLVTEGPNPTVWSLLLGPVGWVVYGASVVAALVLVVRWSDLDGAGVGGGVPH